MRLKLGHVPLARDLYQWMLQQPKLQLPPHAAAMAVRKLKQAQEGGLFGKEGGGGAMRGTVGSSMSSV
eukprot:6562040-Prymnesium_polylepis.1